MPGELPGEEALAIGERGVLVGGIEAAPLERLAAPAEDELVVVHREAEQEHEQQ